MRSAFLARTPRSRALHERGRVALPGGDTRTGTFFAPYPVYLERGEGYRVQDVDGHAYLDFLNNFTALVHGHAHPLILESVARQMARGTAHAAPLEVQVELAERLRARIPALERVRFTNSGTEAVMQAVRAARALTGRTTLLKMEGGYHGTYDGVEVAVEPPVAAGDEGPGAPTYRGAPGVPGLPDRVTDEVLVVPFNDLPAAKAVLDAHQADLAAVIVEPVMHHGGILPAEPGFLEGLRELTREVGVLLILDEIVTLRLAPGGAQELHGLEPDLTTLGKIIGGGFPVGAFGGRAEIMDRFDPRRPDRIVHSGTYNGNAVTVAAGSTALDLLTPEAIGRIDALGERLAGGFRDVLDRAGVPDTVTRAGSLVQLHPVSGPVRHYRDVARADGRVRRLLHLALLERGVFCGSRLQLNVSTPMDEGVVDAAVDALADALDDLAPAFDTPAGRGEARPAGVG